MNYARRAVVNHMKQYAKLWEAPSTTRMEYKFFTCHINGYNFIFVSSTANEIWHPRESNYYWRGWQGAWRV